MNRRGKEKQATKNLNQNVVKNIKVHYCKIWDVVFPDNSQFLAHLYFWPASKNREINQKPPLCHDCSIKFNIVQEFLSDGNGKAHQAKLDFFKYWMKEGRAGGKGFIYSRSHQIGTIMLSSLSTVLMYCSFFMTTVQTTIEHIEACELSSCLCCSKKMEDLARVMQEKQQQLGQATGRIGQQQEALSEAAELKNTFYAQLANL